MKKNTLKNIVGALALASLAACSGSGSCPPGQSPNGELSLAITAPNQYPAGVAVTAYLTMTNTSTVNATNLYYAIPAATNYTGSNNITIQNGVGNNPCVNIAAGASCTFPAQISANSNPGSFTVTATPNGNSQSSINKLVSTVENKLGLQSGSLELTANIGLSNVPTNDNSGANGITFLYAKTVKQNTNGSTLISIVGVVKSATAGEFNNINLTDANGNLLKFENLSGASSQALGQNSIVTFLLEIPAGVNSYSFYGQTTNNGNLVDQGTVKNTINLAEDNVGILNGQPVSFNLQSGYESQVVTYTNTGLGSVSDINFTLPEPLTLISNGCSGKTLASGDSCNYTLGFDPKSLVSGTTTLVATYNNGQSTSNEVDSTINYTALVPVAGLTISGNSNPNFNFNSNTVQTTESSLVTLTNSGTRPLYNLSFDLPTHFTTSVSGVTNPCGSTLAVESSCNISLVYTNGTVTPPVQATATVNYKYTGINQHEYSNSSQVTLSYETTQAMAALSVTPVSQSFGNVLNNNSATSPQQIFTVVNGGPNPASAVSSSFTESNAALFHIISTTCGSSIPANSSCTVTAKFGPFASSTAAGTKTAALTMQYKPYTSSSNTLTAKSTVTGQAVSAQSAVINLSSAVATGFESGNGTQSTPYLVTSGNPAPALTYTLTNSGSVPATSFYLNPAALSGKWTLVANGCGTSGSKVTLSANGGSCSFKVSVSSTSTVQANNFIPSQIQASWIDEDSPAPDGQSQDLSGNTVYASITPPPVSITVTTPNISEGVLMGNYYQFTVTIPAGGNVSPQTITATTTANATTVAAESGTCTLQTTTSPHVTSCTFRVRTSWELTAVGNYSVSLQSNGTATFVPSNTFSYTVTAPAAPVLGTGQTSSLPEDPAPAYSDGYYSAGVKQTGSRFTIGSGAEADCVTDNLTGLMWVRDNYSSIPGYSQFSDAFRNWQNMLNTAESSNFCGHTDWRLPNVNEYVSLMNQSVYNNLNNWLYTQWNTTSLISQYYWTSTALYSRPDDDLPAMAELYYPYNSINQDFSTDAGAYPLFLLVRDTPAIPNAVGKLPKTGQTESSPINPAWNYSDGYYRKGVAWPSPRFLNGTGAQESCVIDKLTGLMWPKDITQVPTHKTTTWESALTAAHNLNYCGYTDWRLPNVNEIRSLINYGAPMLQGSFPNTTHNGYVDWLSANGFTDFKNDEVYWTSSTYTDDTEEAIDFDFVNGMWNELLKVPEEEEEAYEYYVLPVRNGVRPPV